MVGEVAARGVAALRFMWDDLDRRRAARDGGVCAFCHGYGDVVNPGNGDPAVKVTDWLAPVGCPRCGQTGKEPNP